MTTIIATQLAVDPALIMDANYSFNKTDRRYIDDQIRAIEQLLVDNLIKGRQGSWFSLSGTSAAVVPGDTVCQTTGGLVIKSATSPLSTAKSALGVVVRAASPGAKVLVATGGILPPTITGLALSAGFVRVNTTTSRCEKVTTLSGADYGLGTVDASGWMHVVPAINAVGGGGSVGTNDISTAIDQVLGIKGVLLESGDTLGIGETWKKGSGSTLRADKVVPPGWYNPKDYGVVSGDTAGDANAIAMQALLDTTLVADGKGIGIMFPPGTYLFNDNLYIRRHPTDLTGVAGALANTVVGPAVTLHFAAGKGIIVHGPGASTGNPLAWDGTGTKIHDLKLKGTQLTLDAWTTNTVKTVGAKLHSTNKNRYWYECVKVTGDARTGEGAEPNFKGCYITDRTTEWAAGTRYEMGSQVRDYSTSTVVFWLCTQAGTSGGTIPTWNTTIDATNADGDVVWTTTNALGMWIQDDQVLWANRQAAGVWIRTRCIVEDCYIENFTTCGVSGLSAVYPAQNTNQAHVRGNRTYGNGVSIAWRGYDANLWECSYNDCVADGTALVLSNSMDLGTGGVGIWDGGFYGGILANNKVDAGSGQGYVMGRDDLEAGSEQAGAGIMLYCYSEGNLDSIIIGDQVVVGGIIPMSADSAPICIGGSGGGAAGNIGGSRNLRDLDPSFTKRPIAHLNKHGIGLLHAYGNDDEPNDLGWEYQASTWPKTGSWSMSLYQTAPYFALTGRLATEGRGWLSHPVGDFKGGHSSGGYADQYFEGYDPQSLHNTRVRAGTGPYTPYGTFQVGDRFDLQWDGIATHTGWIVSVAGFRGRAIWESEHEYSPAWAVEPTATWGDGFSTVGGKVFMFKEYIGDPGTFGYSSGTVEPDWSSATVPDDTIDDNDGAGNVRWKLVGYVPEYKGTNYIEGAGTI